VPLATGLCKTFVLRMLNDIRAGRKPTKVVVPIEEEEEDDEEEEEEEEEEAGNKRRNVCWPSCELAIFFVRF
jgi:hypothetical protein